MPMNRVLLGAAVLVLVAACTGLRFRAISQPGAPKLEFQNARYDGKELHGRLLVGAVGGPVTLDGRLIEHSTVTVEDVFDCATREQVGVMADSFPPPPRESELITITEGYWYGADVDLLVLTEEVKTSSPDCILATIAVWPRATAGKMVVPAELVVRVMKAAPAAPTVDAGADAGPGDVQQPGPESRLPLPPDSGRPDAG